MARAELMVELQRVADALSDDELRVLTWIAERVQRGHEQYGKLVIESDERDFHIEQFEEVADALFYGGCIALLKQLVRKGQPGVSADVRAADDICGFCGMVGPHYCLAQPRREHAVCAYRRTLRGLLEERRRAAGELPQQREAEFAAKLDAYWSRLTSHQQEQMEESFGGRGVNHD